MKCHECQELIQKRLDGDAVASEALEQHLSECPDCRERNAAALMLLEGVKQLPRPSLAPDFASTLAAEIVRDRRQRMEKMRRRLVLTFALAASVVIMLLVAYAWMPRTPVDVPQPKDDFVKQAPKKDDSIKKKDEPIAKKAEPRSPLSGLTDRVADATRDHARVVLAAANLNDVDKLPVKDLPALDPGMREAGQEVTDGVRAVTRGTRRAFDFFARELPMPETVAKVD